LAVVVLVDAAVAILVLQMLVVIGEQALSMR
jgi:hypothetical protein